LDCSPGESLFLALSVLSATGFSLSLEIGLAMDLSLGLVDSLDKHILVLELVTLRGEVKPVVHLAVNLLLVSVPTEEAAEHAETAHPQNALWHTSVLGTLSFTVALMATLALSFGPALAARARVRGHDFSHDDAVLYQLPNVLAYITAFYN